MVNLSTVTPDVDGLSRKVWLKDVRVSPSDGNTLMGGVIPLKGRRGNGFPRDSVEAQGLRIDIKYYEILWSPNPSYWIPELLVCNRVLVENQPLLMCSRVFIDYTYCLCAGERIIDFSDCLCAGWFLLKIFLADVQYKCYWIITLLVCSEVFIDSFSCLCIIYMLLK